jgi:phosphoadenosine phosphosulfate reductase
LSVVTVIEGAPRERREVLDSAIAARLKRLQVEAAQRDPQGIVALALSEFPGKAALVSSFGAESAVLLHMAASIDPNTPVLFLNTGKLFGETLRYRDRLQDVFGLGDLRAVAPHPADRAHLDAEGTLWSSDPDACCHFRKVMPLRRMLEGFDASITGRKRFQTSARSEMSPVEYFEGRFRFNPLAAWSQIELEEYLTAHDLPRHPLVDDGYPSIGCMPCTRRVKTGESYRDGRWAGLDKDECGIHVGVDGEGI